MQLYGSYTSPFVRHCRIALLEGKLDCEFIETDLNGSAQGSPTQKVPFLRDGELMLTDSCSILMHLRAKSGGVFFNDAQDYDLFCMVNTVMDATVNLFFLERDDKLGPAQSTYLARQNARISSGLLQLEGRAWPLSLCSGSQALAEGELRLACYLAWGLFRKRLSLDQYPALAAFLRLAGEHPPFAETAPPVA